MAWSWRYERSDGTEVLPVAGTVPQFPTQADAESWVGEVWRELLEQGVDGVSLLENGNRVYGPMSLHAPE
ncbi:MAG: hypothetical protein ACT4QG_03030 [Sporichthyaceae bacterium]